MLQFSIIGNFLKIATIMSSAAIQANTETMQWLAHTLP